MSPSPSVGPKGPARLTARSPDPGIPAPPPGTRPLELGPGPEVLVHVPAGLDGAAPARLVLVLHGAGGTPQGGLAPLLPLADAHRLLLVAPQSAGATWDVIVGGFGPDVRRIDEALSAVLTTVPVAPEPLAVSGFSDGASYALTLGLANGDLFTHVVAFSPGFVAPTSTVGTPRVFVSHGRADAVLPIDRTTRRIVPRLRGSGVPVELREFDGPHAVPPAVAEAAADWLTR